MKPPPPMTGAELVAEIEWLLEFDVHPAMICQQLGRTPAALEKRCRDRERPDLAAVFYPELKYARRGRSAA